MEERPRSHVAFQTQNVSRASACARRVSREPAEGQTNRRTDGSEDTSRFLPLLARVIREVPRWTLPDKVKRRMKRSGREAD